MPGKGLEKRGGVPSSPCGLRRDKLRRGKRTDPAKGLFPLLNYRPLLGTEPLFVIFQYPVSTIVIVFPVHFSYRMLARLDVVADLTAD